MSRQALMLATVMGWAAEASATNSWLFDVETTGNDVSWTSPTAVDPAAAVFSGEYELQSITVDVMWNGLNFSDLDVTDLVPADLVSGGGLIDGPAPIEFLNDTLVFPEPPEAPALSADLVIGVDPTGTAFLNATNVAFGTLSIDLGGLFGVQSVDLTRVRIVGGITVHGTWFDLGGAAVGASGAPLLTGSGALIGGQPMGLGLANAVENSLAGLIIGFSTLDAPFLGGTFVPSINLALFLPTDAEGKIALASNWANGVPPDTPVYFQYWIFDNAAVGGLSASNAVLGVSP